MLPAGRPRATSRRRETCSIERAAPGFSVYDQWEAQLLAIILQKARVGLFSEIPPEEVSGAHLEPVFDIAGCVAEELKTKVSTAAIEYP